MSAQEARKLPPPIPPEAKKSSKETAAKHVRDNVVGITSAQRRTPLAPPKHFPRAYRKTAVGREYLKPVRSEDEDSEVKKEMREILTMHAERYGLETPSEAEEAVEKILKMLDKRAA
jgi:hypothetical protein